MGCSPLLSASVTSTGVAGVDLGGLGVGLADGFVVAAGRAEEGEADEDGEDAAHGGLLGGQPVVRAAKPRPTKTSVVARSGMGESSRIWPATGSSIGTLAMRGGLGAEDAAVRGAVDGGDVDAVLGVGPGGADGEPGDRPAGLLGLGDDALGDEAAVGRRGREPRADLDGDLEAGSVLDRLDERAADGHALSGQDGVEQGAVDEQLGAGVVEDAGDDPHAGGHDVGVRVLDARRRSRRGWRSGSNGSGKLDTPCSTTTSGSPVSGGAVVVGAVVVVLTGSVVAGGGRRPSSSLLQPRTSERRRRSERGGATATPAH